MTVQIFIFCWNNYVKNTIELENNLSLFGNVWVINSNIYEKKDHWINLNDAYFPGQWNALINNLDFNSDFIFHIQSDATIPNYNLLFDRLNYLTSKYDIGIYSPNVNYTWHSYNITKLNKIENDVYEVPNTDCTCWAIKTSLFDKHPLFNLNTNWMGYGVDSYYSAKSRCLKKLVIRDYTITISHPKHKNYSNHEANVQFQHWYNEQEDYIKKEIDVINCEIKEKNENLLKQ